MSFGDESLLYPDGALKVDEYYFDKKRAECDKSMSREARRLDQKRTNRRTYFLHTLSTTIIQECVERDVGTIVGATSRVSAGTAKPAISLIGATTATSICTGEHSIGSRRCPNIKPRPKGSRSPASPNEILRSRVRPVAEPTTSASSVGCTSARSVGWFRMLTVMEPGTFDKRYFRIFTG